MCVLSVFATVLATFRLVHAQNDDEENNNESRTTITSTATLACATGEAQSRYESCSSSISRKIGECNNNDFKCACSHAQAGFGCVTSYCKTHTSAVCAASYILAGLCSAVSEPGPTFTDYECPPASSVLGDLTSLIPTDIASLVSSEMDNIPSDIPFFGGPSNIPHLHGPAAQSSNSEGSERQSATETTTVRGEESSPSVTRDQVPSPSGGVSGGWHRRGQDGELLSGVLGVGILTAVMVAGLAALL